MNETHAFPRSSGGGYDPAQCGMTLRDYFAGQALAGIAQAVTITHLTMQAQTPPDDIAAKWAVGFADALIAELQKEVAR